MEIAISSSSENLSRGDNSSTEDSSDTDPRDIVNMSGIILNKKKHSRLRTVGEEEWSTATEQLVTRWANDCKDRADVHEKQKARQKFLHACFGLPSILLPVVMAAITPVIDETPEGMYIQVAGFVTIGVFSTVNAFFNFDKKSARHGEFAARFSELATDVQFQLFKSREFRTSADEFVARLQTKYTNLVERAP